MNKKSRLYISRGCKQNYISGLNKKIAEAKTKYEELTEKEILQLQRKNADCCATKKKQETIKNIDMTNRSKNLRNL